MLHNGIQDPASFCLSSECCTFDPVCETWAYDIWQSGASHFISRRVYCWGLKRKVLQQIFHCFSLVKAGSQVQVKAGSQVQVLSFPSPPVGLGKDRSAFHQTKGQPQSLEMQSWHGSSVEKDGGGYWAGST